MRNLNANQIIKSMVESSDRFEGMLNKLYFAKYQANRLDDMAWEYTKAKRNDWEGIYDLRDTARHYWISAFEAVVQEIAWYLDELGWISYDDFDDLLERLSEFGLVERGLFAIGQTKPEVGYFTSDNGNLCYGYSDDFLTYAGLLLERQPIYPTGSGIVFPSTFTRR